MIDKNELMDDENPERVIMKDGKPVAIRKIVADILKKRETAEG